MFNKIKNFLGTDIKTDKYKKVDDAKFGKISNFTMSGYVVPVVTVGLVVVFTSA